MTQALRFHETGGPDVFRWEEVEVPAPGDGEVRIRHAALGFNSLDADQRAGRMAPSSFPCITGIEGAGTVEAVGSGVDGWREGDRVAYPLSFGAYAETRLVKATALVALPNDITETQAAAVLTKGLTVYQLFVRMSRLARGDTILFHAAAGGVGLLACRWAAQIGVRLIGTVGSDDKATIIKTNGAAEAIVYTREDTAARVREITGGDGVAAVFDSVGKDTIDSSIAALGTYGTLVRFGDTSGEVVTSSKSLPVSTFFAKASVMTLMRHPNDYRAALDAVWSMTRDGTLRADEAATFALQDAGAAHTLFETRRNIGPIVFTV